MYCSHLIIISGIYAVVPRAGASPRLSNNSMRSGGAGNIRATMASSILFLAALSLGVCGELKETYSASLHRRGAALSGSGSGGGPTVSLRSSRVIVTMVHVDDFNL